MGYLVFVIGFSYVIFVCRLDAVREPAVNLFAVSGFKELGSFYYQLLANNPIGAEHNLGCKKREISLKKQICRSIFSSFHFDYQHETLVEPNHWQIRYELKHRYRSIYNDLFKDAEKPFRIKSAMKKKKCLNPRTLRRVHLPGELSKITDKHYLQEDVFVCLVREVQSGSIKQYYVSREYNLNEVTNSACTDYVAGRFVFESPSSDTVSLHALAELPARIMMGENVELIYARAKKGNEKLVDNPQDDPICSLSSGEKFRLCSVIFHSSVYGKRVKFWPGCSSVGFECKRKAVEFQTTEMKRQTSNLVYEEWVISCHAMSRFSNAWKTYYVSRGYSPRSAFIYRFLNGKLVLERRSTEINLLRSDC